MSLESFTLKSPFTNTEYHLAEQLEKAQSNLEWANGKICELHVELATARGTYDPRDDYSGDYPGGRLRATPTLLTVGGSENNGQDSPPESTDKYQERRETFSICSEDLRQNKGIDYLDEVADAGC